MSKKTIETFFACIDRLHAGDESAIRDMLNLWRSDGRWTFNGAYPLGGEFRGKLAIEVYLRNLVHSSKIPVSLEKEGSSALARNNVEIRRVSQKDDNWVAEWDQVVATEDGHGGAFGGSSVFRFSDEKISSVDVTVWPRPEAQRAGLLAELKIADLTVTDVGRLALAAWAVV